MSPLNSIIDEQRNKLGKYCFVIDSGVIANLKRGSCDEGFMTSQYDYILGHPELLLSSELWPVFRNKEWQSRKIYIVVDECHCVVKWGQSFRQKYKEICRLRSVFTCCRMLALTATATTAMRVEIADSLLMKEYAVVTASVNRNNIYLSVKRRDTEETSKMSANDAFIATLSPYFFELETYREKMPLTLVYTKLDWCGLGDEYVDRVLGYGNLSSQYHAQCTDEVICSYIMSYVVCLNEYYDLVC
jgi:hypothetical protein